MTISLLCADEQATQLQTGDNFSFYKRTGQITFGRQLQKLGNRLYFLAGGVMRNKYSLDHSLTALLPNESAQKVRAVQAIAQLIATLAGLQGVRFVEETESIIKYEFI